MVSYDLADIIFGFQLVDSVDKCDLFLFRYDIDIDTCNTVLVAEQPNDFLAGHAAQSVEAFCGKVDVVASHRIAPRDIVKRHRVCEGSVAIKNESGVAVAEVQVCDPVPSGSC